MEIQYVFSELWSGIYEWGILRDCRSLDYIALNGTIVDENWEDLEGNGHGLIQKISQNFIGGTDENQRNFRQDSQRSGRDSNRSPPQNEYIALSPRQPALSPEFLFRY
jgi:hypothetical protein